MNLVSQIQKQIKEIEERIAGQQGDLRSLNEILQRLKMQEFEEDLRQQDGKQLLQE